MAYAWIHAHSPDALIHNDVGESLFPLMSAMGGASSLANLRMWLYLF
jgi:hypothetical protein